MGHVVASLTQSAYRFRNDDGNQATATWMALENTPVSIDVDTTKRVRVVIQETAGGAENNLTSQWQYNLNGAGWVNITTTSSVVRAVTSGNVADGIPTTDQIGGTGTFVAGEVTADGLSDATRPSFAGNDHTEIELVFQIRGVDVADNDSIQFRIIRSGGTLEAWTQIPVATANLASAFDMDSYRWRNDDGSESTATWREATNRHSALPTDTTIRLRTLLQEAAGVGGTIEFELQFRTWIGEVYSAWTTVGSPVADAIVRMAPAAGFNHLQATTQQLGAGAFSAGVCVENNNTGASVTVGANNETEIEWSIEVRSSATGYNPRMGLEFRVVEYFNQPLTSYTRLALAAPELSLANTFEAAEVDGTAITPANSGGSAGDPFDFVLGSTAEFDSAQAAHGVLSMLLTGASGTSIKPSWDDLGQSGVSFYRFYLRIPATPSSVQRIFQIDSADGATWVALEVNATTRTLKARGPTTNPLYTFTSAIPLDQWVRIELMIDVGANATECRLYLTADSTTADETQTGTADGLTDQDQVFYMVSNFNESFPLWHDDIAFSNIDWIGSAGSLAESVDVAGTLPLLEASAAVDALADVAVSASLPALDASAAITPSSTVATAASLPEFSAQAAIDVPALEVAVSGTLPVLDTNASIDVLSNVGVVAGLSELTAVVSMGANSDVGADVLLPEVSGQAAIDVPALEVAVSASLPALDASASAQALVDVVAGANLPEIVGNTSIDARTDLAVAAGLPELIAEASIVEVAVTQVGVGATLPVLDAHGTVAANSSADLTGSLGEMAAEAQVDASSTVDGAALLPELGAEASAEATASADVAAPLPEMAAATQLSSRSDVDVASVLPEMSAQVAVDNAPGETAAVVASLPQLDASAVVGAGSSLDAGATLPTIEAQVQVEGLVSATAAATLPELGGGVEIAAQNQVATAASLPNLEAQVEVDAANSVVVAAALPGLDAGVNVDVPDLSTLTVSAALPEITASSAIDASATASTSADLPALTGDLAVASQVDINVVGGLPALEVGADIDASNATSVAGQLPEMVAEANLDARSNVTWDATLPSLVAQAELLLAGTLTTTMRIEARHYDKAIGARQYGSQTDTRQYGSQTDTRQYGSQTDTALYDAEIERQVGF